MTLEKLQHKEALEVPQHGYEFRNGSLVVESWYMHHVLNSTSPVITLPGYVDIEKQDNVLSDSKDPTFHPLPGNLWDH